jgi:hypothetical protein
MTFMNMKISWNGSLKRLAIGGNPTESPFAKGGELIPLERDST